MSDTARIHHFADFFSMAPGTLLGGFVKDEDSWRLATDWYLPGGLDKRNVIPMAFTTEHNATWRRKYRSVSKMVGTTRFYKASVPKSTSGLYPRKMVVKIPVGQPVGIYLGHILQSDENCYVNVLLGEGYDVWIRAI